MTNTYPESRFTGVYATPELVGRARLRNQIQQVLAEPSTHPRTIFLVGRGGIGKTRLLQTALETAQEMGLLAAEHLIDLYDMPNHTPGGLAQSIYHVLPAEPFRQYEREYRSLQRMFATGDTAGVAEQTDRVFATFVQNLQTLARREKIVLVLDTAERLVYQTIQAPGAEPQFAESWNWLAEMIPHLNNIVLLIAGRPEAEPLRRSLQAGMPDGVVDIAVEPFDEQESLDYFDAVARLARDEHDPGLARRIDLLSMDYRRLAHRASGGQPILLALLLDYLSLAPTGDVPDILQAPVQEILAQPEAELPAIRARFEAQLINRLISTPGMSETIEALGRVPKGSDNLLLARLIGVSPDDAEQRLHTIKQLSFVKVRDQRVFLHDEMYRLLQTHIYDRPEDAPRADESFEIIVQYYKDQLAQCQHTLDAIYAPVEIEGKERLDEIELARVSAIQQALTIEIVYYQLRQQPGWGFQHYFRAAKDASNTNNAALDAQLEAEMVTFLQERDPGGKLAVMEGLDRRSVMSVLLLRPVIRAFPSLTPDQFLERAAELRQQIERLINPEPATDDLRIALASLSVWEGQAMTYIGDEPHMRQAQHKFAEAIQQIDAFLAAVPASDFRNEIRRWRAKFALAFAYRVRGYFRRVRGMLSDSIEDTRKSAALWREMKMENELATSLNNLGFALSSIGQREDARSLVEEALELRRARGSRSLVGLSLNTLALIRLRDSAYSTAVDLSERALTLFRALRDQRGAGLALIALSDTLRRYSEGTFMLTVEDKVRHLREACDCAQEARSIFEQTGERERQIETLINEGCAYRDWVSLRRSHPNPRDNIERLAAKSEQSLRLAVELAGPELLYRKVDALINLGWLGFYAGMYDLLTEATEQAEAAIPAAYRFSTAHGMPTIPWEEAQMLLWPQLGKLHILYGHRAFQDLVTLPGPAPASTLAEITRHYTLGLEYNNLHGSDFPGLRSARDQVYNHLKRLEVSDLHTIAQQVIQTTSAFHLESSTLQELLQNRALWYG